MKKKSEYRELAHHESTGNRLVEVDENGNFVRVVYGGLRDDISANQSVVDGFIARPLVSAVFRENDKKS